MKYYIGLDGGGTKTKCVLCDENFDVIQNVIGGPSNFLTIGLEKVSDTILTLLSDCISASKIQCEQIKLSLIGTTGAGRKSDALKLESAVRELAKRKNVSIPQFKVESDARIALEGAFSGKSGSILIAGTGSIMFGKDKSGQIHRVGGYGRLIGDEGSGLTIGRKGLNILAKFLDGRSPGSSIVDTLMEKFEIKNESDLISKVYNNEINTQDVAPYVINAAENNDELCKTILDDETNELLMHIVAMKNHLKEDKMKIVFIGGTIANNNLYSRMLREKIKTYLPNLVIQKAEYPPEIGAVIMAKHYSDKV